MCQAPAPLEGRARFEALEEESPRVPSRSQAIVDDAEAVAERDPGLLRHRWGVKRSCRSGQ